MAAWDFITQTRGGLALANLTDLGARKIDLYINQPGAVGGEIALSSPQCVRELVTPGVHELSVIRDGVPLETVFQLATADPQDDTEGNGKVDLGWLGIASYLSDLTLDSTYARTAAQDVVAFDIINTVQTKSATANYGIINGTHTPGQPSKTFSLSDQGEMDAKEAITNLSERADGFDHWIGYSREFNTSFPARGRDLTGSVVFRHGANCTFNSLQEDASPGSIVNFVRVKGGDGAVATAEDIVSQGLYGRREAIITYSDVISSVATLQSYADAVLLARSSPVIVPEVILDTQHASFDFHAAWLGDVVRMVGTVGDAPYTTIDAPFRIVALHIELDNENYETISYELNPA